MFRTLVSLGDYRVNEVCRVGEPLVACSCDGCISREKRKYVNTYPRNTKISNDIHDKMAMNYLQQACEDTTHTPNEKRIAMERIIIEGKLYQSQPLVFDLIDSCIKKYSQT